MNVVWSYRDYSGCTMDSGNAGCDLETEPLELAALEASALSWIKFAPRIQRIFYADEPVYDILKKNNLLQLYNRVVVVDYAKSLDGKYTRLGKFFAYPKMYAMTQQEEPFFICDTDCVLRDRISLWLKDWTKYYAYYYVENSTRTPSDATEVELSQLASISQRTPLLRSFCDYTRTVNAGLMFFADPKVGQCLGHLLLEAGLDIQEGIDNRSNKEPGVRLLWTLYEESFIHNLVEFLAKQPIEEIPLNMFEEFSNGYYEGRNRKEVLEEIADACKCPFLKEKYQKLVCE